MVKTASICRYCVHLLNERWCDYVGAIKASELDKPGECAWYKKGEKGNACESLGRVQRERVDCCA